MVLRMPRTYVAVHTTLQAIQKYPAVRVAMSLELESPAMALLTSAHAATMELRTMRRNEARVMGVTLLSNTQTSP